LAHINQAYQNIIGPKLKIYKNATPTVTVGVFPVPSDFLEIVSVWDGTLDDGVELEEIYDLADKAKDDAECTQYFVADEETIWIYGQTPTTTVTIYYFAQPAALTDSLSSYPTKLNKKFHQNAFTTYIKMIISKERNESDYFTLQAEWLDILDEIGDLKSSCFQQKIWW